ncbi:MAG TPA: fumarylacetoacetate hydrolase family protein [Candidatus Saccharimonadales bacterium]|nr:fumarylacetoacetate hydrolase family protein [Candidatus Saccharimonadales bacterium]
MRLARVEVDGRPRLGVVSGADVLLLDRDRSGAAGDDVVGVAGDPSVLDALWAIAHGEAVPDRRIPLEAVRILAPVARPRKIVAIGLNYVDHAKEAEQSPPASPLVFAKFPSAIAGPGEPITFDRSVTTEVDFEAELAVVMGRRARNVDERIALDHVLGYTCCNDVSARDVQFSDGQWVRGKSLDTFCPLGPWVVTRDEIADVQALAIRCVVSGEVMQDASTADMFFSVAELIARLSRSFTLEPGDVIATGTPPGVGYFRVPRRLLQAGDEVVVEIDGIGRLCNPVVEAS